MYSGENKLFVDYYSCCFSFSDACDPSWRSTRDGMTYSAFAISIFTSNFTINLIFVHICWHNIEEVRQKKWWQIVLLLILATLIVGFGLILLAVVLCCKWTMYVASHTPQVIMGYV